MNFYKLIIKGRGLFLIVSIFICNSIFAQQFTNPILAGFYPDPFIFGPVAIIILLILPLLNFPAYPFFTVKIYQTCNKLVLY